MADEWLSAQAARDLLYPVAGLDVAKRICARANDGLISARAKRLILNDKVVDDCNVPTDFWWAHGGGALKQNWGCGDFETRIAKRIVARAYGVEFLRADIEAMLPPRPAPKGLARSTPGNYAPASECRKELVKSLGATDEEVEAMILRHCRADLLPGRCAAMLTRTRTRYGESEELDYNVPIPPWFWEYCIYSSNSILNWPREQVFWSGIHRW